ncbi:MAG: shikimate dehydrogenase [Candidatus Kryptoniota bacterium]
MKRNIKVPAKIVGIIGHPVSHTFSPQIHETAFKLTKQNYTYQVFDVHPKNVRDALRGIVALGIVGLNVTVPHKEAVLEFLDEISADARLVGAVNCIHCDNETLIGYNTDIYGVLETLKPHRERIMGEPVTVFGAGGGARAVIYTLVTYFKPSQIFVVNRDISRAEILKKFFADSQNYTNIKVVELHNPDENLAIDASRLVINATPVGMYPNTGESIILTDSKDLEGKIFFDLIYNPVETEFLRIAREKNAIAIGGIEMLYQQAAKAFEIWTGVPMPIEKVRSKLDATLFNQNKRKP